MKLIIAEKPMLARAIADAIPGTAVNKKDYTEKGGYTIVSAFGHLLTLKEPEDYDAEKYRKWSLEALPIYFPDWGKKPGDGKAERLNLIGTLLKNADCVIHAGDPDDEGQYLIDEILNWFSYEGPVYRLSTGDTTEAALAHALRHMKDNRECVNAGWSAHARSVADIMVGFNFSRYFSLMNPHVKMLTVGRVQTPTLGLVVARDLAIENHEKQYYYLVKGTVALPEHTVPVRLEPQKDDPNLEDGKLTDRSYAGELAAGLQGCALPEITIRRKELTEQPPLPFNLVKLQTYCSNKFGYEPSETLAITQTLRDNHNAITYNRSDCQYLSEEQYKQSPGTVRRVLENLKNDSAGEILSRLPLDTALHSKAFDDKNITAHTAIIPQNRAIDMNKLSEKERNVYLAIVKYYFAQFLPPAKKLRTTLECPVETGMLRASSVQIGSPGYLQLIRPEKGKDEDDGEEENELSLIAPGTYSGTCSEASVEEKETKAPPRYTKASLNEDMTRIARYVTDPKAKALLLAKDKDKKGENGSIGTSATRSGIIDMLEERGYIVSKGKQIQSTELGRELCRILPASLRTPDMTGYWWAIQESVMDGSRPWTDLTDSVLELIKEILATSCPKVDAYHVPEDMRRGKLLLGSCPRCGKDIIEGKTGFGCAGWRDGCKFTVWKTAKTGMLSKTEITADMVHQWLASGWTEELRTAADGSTAPTGRKRTVAALPMKGLWSESKKTSYSAKIYLTDDGPGSQFGAGTGVDEILREPPVPLGKCPRCGKDVIEGKTAYGCSGWRDGCKFTIWKKAKSGMMAKTTVTKAMVKNLLKSPWAEESLPEDALPGQALRRRTEKTVRVRKLWSERSGRTYAGDVFLYDDGPSSPHGAAFGLAGISNEAPESLGSCPRCGKDIIEGKTGYGCSGWRDGCKFTVWKTAKSGFMVKTTVTKAMVKALLKGPWTEDTLPPEPGRPSGRCRRTETTVHCKTLWSEREGKTMEGEVYLIDDGSPYGAAFGFSQVTGELLGKCPRCGKPVIEGNRGFGCSGYKDGCRFTIWKKSKMRLLGNITFTKTDAKKFLAGKPVKKKKLLDDKNREFTGELLMVEEADNPFGPVYRVVAGSIEVKEGDASQIRTVLVPRPGDVPVVKDTLPEITVTAPGEPEKLYSPPENVPPPYTEETAPPPDDNDAPPEQDAYFQFDM